MSVATLVALGAFVLAALSGVLLLPSSDSAAFAQSSPSVAVSLSPSGSVEQGTAITATMSFSNLEDDADTSTTDYIFRADVIGAGECEGGGLGKTRYMYKVDEDPETRGATISAGCPAGDYTLRVSISSPDNVELASSSAAFSVTEPEVNAVLEGRSPSSSCRKGRWRAPSRPPSRQSRGSSAASAAARCRCAGPTPATAAGRTTKPTRGGTPAGRYWGATWRRRQRHGLTASRSLFGIPKVGLSGSGVTLRPWNPAVGLQAGSSARSRSSAATMRATPRSRRAMCRSLRAMESSPSPGMRPPTPRPRRSRTPLSSIRCSGSRAARTGTPAAARRSRSCRPP